MSRILKRKEWDRNDLLQIALYHDFIQKNEDGWFNVDEIINYISGIRRCQNKPEYDFQTLEKHVYNDVDHRYIFNEDKTVTKEQREKALDAAKVISTATAAGAGTAATMSVLAGSLGALGIGAIAINPALVAAVGVGGWVAGMLSKTKQAEKKKQSKKGDKKYD